MPHEEPTILPYEPQTGPAKLVGIGPFRDLIEANLAVGVLRDEGIRASLAGENVAATLGPIYGAAYAGGPIVMVPEEDEADARRLIKSIEDTRRHRTAADSPACPFCAARPTNRVIHPLRWLALLTMFGGGLALHMSPLALVLVIAGIAMLVWSVTPIWKCPACQRRFAAPVPDDDADDADENPTSPTV